MMGQQPQKPFIPEFAFRGILKGHNDVVTCISTDLANPKGIVLSSSRDKTILVWKVVDDSSGFAKPVKSLKGHGHFVSDVKISFNSSYAISSSWDNVLRLWDLGTGQSVRRFIGHTAEVLSVSFSAMDSRQIVSGSADRSIKLWNTLGECKAEFVEKGHQDWVTCVRFSPSPDDPVVVSCGRDSVVKVWDMRKFTLKRDFIGHTGYLNSVAISPDGTLCASGGQGGMVMLWELGDGKSRYLYTLDTGGTLSALTFSPTRYWLCTASGVSIKIWDLEFRIVVAELIPDTFCNGKYASGYACTALAWSSNGLYLYAGYSDGTIRVWSYAPPPPQPSTS